MDANLELKQQLVDGIRMLECHLHAGIYRARPDVEAVVHAHPKWSTWRADRLAAYQEENAQGQA